MLLSDFASLRLLCGTLVVAMSLTLSATLAALPKDREQPIHISADSAELDDRTGVALYRGRVHLVQGSLEIEARQLRVETDAEGIKRLEAQGDPALYRQRTQPREPLARGRAATIEYRVRDRLVVFQGQAHLERAQDRFSGARIEINTRSNLIKARGGAQDANSRVRMVIQPKSRTDATGSEAAAGTKQKPGTEDQP